MKTINENDWFKSDTERNSKFKEIDRFVLYVTVGSFWVHMLLHYLGVS